ncbi:MAG: hypothetical protein JOY98_08135 [Candidatus Eremiobacteraeota bacterium]|nr:hypothetical protein [Candidatus Eremiobacteraeota bacterium]
MRSRVPLLALALALIAATDSPPGVARVSAIAHGTVVVTRSDKNKTQTTATVNTPIFPGDFVATTDPATLAEVQLDGYTALRLSGGAQTRIVSNDAKGAQIQVADGLVELAILHESKPGVDVVTPPVTVHASRQGDYRISIHVDGAMSLTARSGEAELVTPHKTFTVDPGATVIVSGDAAHPTVQYVDEVARDAFDEFNHMRDRAMYAAINANANVPPDIAGYDDLDKYGHWANVAPYGQSWIPNQTADWAPYRDGTWVWGSPYGWTWVASEPWGWLPYHYGSWFYASGYGWCWFPPSFTVTPVWFPAFVAFFGYGYGSYGFPYYGWVPLAPYETFYPWYPWYWGYYYPWSPPQRPLPPIPPPPPPRHHRDPIHMHPFERAYRNAIDGGASAIDPRTRHDAAPRPPIEVDPIGLGTVTLQHGGTPVPLPETHPVARAHPIVLSGRFDTPRYAPPASLAHIPHAAAPQESSADRAWSQFYSSQSALQAAGFPAMSGMPASTGMPSYRTPGASSVPSMSGTPAMHAPSAPVEHAPAPVPVQQGAPVERGGDKPPRPPA